VTLESGLLLGGAHFSPVRRLRLDYLGVGGQRLWALGATSPGSILGHVAVPGFARLFSASFFLSMLGISRGTYIGDYELK